MKVASATAPDVNFIVGLLGKMRSGTRMYDEVVKRVRLRSRCNGHQSSLSGGSRSVNTHGLVRGFQRNGIIQLHTTSPEIICI